MVDGREKMHATVAEFVTQEMKLYDPKLLKDQMEGMVSSLCTTARATPCHVDFVACDLPYF